MNPIDAYLVALEKELSRHLSESEVRVRVDEVRSHLAMDIADRVTACIDSDDASRLARRALGSPRVVARHMVRQARGYDSASAIRLTLLLGLVLVVSLSLPMWCMVRNIQMEQSVAVIHWLPFLVLIGFGAQVVRTQRWLVLPMAGWSIVASVAMIWAGMIPFTPPSKRVIDQSKASLADLRQQDRLVQQWRAGRPSTSIAPEVARNIEYSFYVPFSPINLPGAKRTYVLTSLPPAQAAEAWRLNGKAFELDLNQQIASSEHWLRDIQVGRTASEMVYGSAILGVWSLSMHMTEVLLVVNVLMLGLSNVLGRRRNRRDPLLA